MDFDLSVEPVGYASSSLASSVGGGASPADAGFASPDDIDAINTSPLAYFGNIIEQVGKSMSSEGQSAAQGGADPSHGMGDAIDMLDSIVSMMSLYATGDAQTPGASNELPNSAGPKALET